MIKDPQTIILQILEIIHYQSDKEKFAREFIDLCCKHAFVEIIGELPVDKAQELGRQVKAVKEFSQFIALLQTYIPRSVLEKQIEVASARLFEEYVEEILPTLDSATKATLLDYLDTLKTH